MADRDHELELAKKLVDSGNSDQTHDNILPKPEGFSEHQLAEFQQARECLQLLRLTLPDGQGSTAGETGQHETHRDDNTGEKQPAADQYCYPNHQDGLKRIGRFRIEREIGKGGFGIVLLARDETLARDVALKIPRAETILSPESRKRFEREARAAGMLSHPAIVPIYESGQIGPVNYIAFAYCDGISLDDWLENQANIANPELAARIVARLADAVSHAHRRGVIHRDLKPANILIDSSGDASSNDITGRLRITDFGLALLASDNENLTVDGSHIGTPVYMSPEQARGSNSSSPAIDIYSLGVILFQLLTGKVPFSGKSNLAIFKSITETPAPSPKQLNSSVPNDLAAVCLKCLEKDPEQRYASAADLNDELVRFLENRPIRARRKSWVHQCQLWAKRNSLLATLSSLLLLSLLIGLGATWQQYNRSQNNLEFAESNFRDAKSTVDELMEKAMSIELAAQPKIRKEMLVTVSRFYQDFITQGQNDPSLAIELAQANRNLGAIESKMGNYNQAIEFYAAAKRLFDEGVSPQSPAEQQLGKLHNQIDIGLQYDHLKQLETALESYDSARILSEDLQDRFPVDPEFRSAHSRLLKNIGAVLTQEPGEEAEAMEYFEQTELIRKQLCDEFPDNNKYRYSLAQLHSSKTVWYIDQRQHEKAIQECDFYRTVIDQLLEAEPDNLTYKIQNARMWNRTGDVYRAIRTTDSLKKAVELYQTAELLQQPIANDYPLFSQIQMDLDNTLMNMAQSYAILGQHELAIRKIEESKRRGESRLHRESGMENEIVLQFSLAKRERQLGMSCVNVQQPEKAMLCFNRGLKHCDDLLQHHDYEGAKKEKRRLLVERGQLYFNLRKQKPAIKDFQQHIALEGKNKRAEVYLARIRLFGDAEFRDPVEALRLTNSIIEDSPKGILSNKTHAAALCLNGEFREAIRYSNWATKLNRAREQGESFIRSIAFVNQGDIDRAKNELDAGNKYLAGHQQNKQWQFTKEECRHLQAAAESAITSAIHDND